MSDLSDQSSLDQLRNEIRNDIAMTLCRFDGYDDEPEESTAADYLARADHIIADVFVGARDSRSRQLAILNLIGLEAWEGQLWTKQAPSGSTVFPEWVCTNGVFEPAWSEANQEPVDCLVVRPRERQADA